MTHVYFDPDSVNWSAFLSMQEGRGKYFVGSKYQHGFGVFSNVAKFLLPIAKNILTTAGQQGIETGTKILGDLSQGKDFKQTLTEHSKQGLQNIADKLKQCGKGRAKKSKRKIKNNKLILPNNAIKRKHIDQLSFV